MCMEIGSEINGEYRSAEDYPLPCPYNVEPRITDRKAVPDTSTYRMTDWSEPDPNARRCDRRSCALHFPGLSLRGEQGSDDAVTCWGENGDSIPL